MDTLKDLIEKKQNEQVISLIKDKNIYEDEFIDLNGENLLHWAAAFNNVEICQFILENEMIHVNLSNYRGTTPLYYGAMRNSIGAIKILLNFNANPRIRSDFSGKFPFEITDNDEVKKLLIQANELIPLTDYNLTLKLKKTSNHYSSYKYRPEKYIQPI